jgi:hypothetical protein
VDAYVYGVLRAPAGNLGSREGVDGEQVGLVEHGDLAALVSDAPNVPVKANRRNLTAHSRILQEVARERCVLPMRFGVVMPGREAVSRELLEARADELRVELDAFEPYVELDLRVICPEEVLLRSVVAERRDVAALRDALAGRPAEASYHDRIRLGELVSDAVAAKRETLTRRVTAKLEPLAVATEVGEALHEEMLANLAFLVARDSVSQFDEAVDRLGKDFGPNVSIRYVGPLAPHRFVTLESGARAWA